MFDSLVDITEPICQKINESKASKTIYDISSICYWNFDDFYDPYKAAYGSMPSHALSNQEIKQLYTNSHFCYVPYLVLLLMDWHCKSKCFPGAHSNIVIDRNQIQICCWTINQPFFYLWTINQQIYLRLIFNCFFFSYLFLIVSQLHIKLLYLYLWLIVDD